MSELKQKIIDNLKEIYDPEIPVNVYDLGLIYEINVKDSGNVNIVMSLTSPTCPTAEYIKTMIEDAVKSTDGVKEVDVELTFDPMWTPERVSEEAREELGLVESPDDNAGITTMFQNNSGNEKESICFNCAATDDKYPVFSCKYKGEETYLCSKCLSKFS